MQATVQKLKFQLNIISTKKCRAYRRFQSNSTPAEYHRATILISEINSRAHRVIKEAKDAKFATLLKEVTSKSSTNDCDASLGKRTVVTIPEDLPLNSAEHSVLSKGLTFVPTVNKTDEYQVKADCAKFFRRLRLKAHFHDSEDEHHEGDNQHDPFTKFDNKTSTWTPPDRKFSALDHYIDRCRQSIASRNYMRRPNFSNLTQEEKTALQDFKRRNDIIIKPADKGGAVVVWKRDLYIQEANRQLSDNRFYQRLDADPIQQDQKIVKNTIKDMITSCELPPTAKHLVVTTPHTSRFYMLPKIHKPNNPGRPIVSACCCPTEKISAYLDEVMAHNFLLTSKIQTMLLASLAHSISMNLINVLAFFSPWTSNRCILSSPTMADYRLSPISLTKGLLRNHLHTPWFARRSWY